MITDLQKSGLFKIAKAYLGNVSPVFSQIYSSDLCKNIIQSAPPEDQSSLKLFLTLMGILPSCFVETLIQFVNYFSKKESQFFATIRLLDFGLRGLVFSLYYNDNYATGLSVPRRIGWNTNMETTTHNNPSSFSKDLSSVKLGSLRGESLVKNLTLDQRLEIISHLKNHILENVETLIDRIQKECPKSRTDILMSEIFSTVDYLQFLINESKKHLAVRNMKTPIALMGKKSKVVLEPLGTLLVIAPWNYPFYQALVPICQSFVCGNATIFKPSEVTPLNGLIENLLDKSGFPKDSVQVVYGDGKTGADLIDLKPQKIFFTGSPATGQKIMKHASQYLIPVELELGGKDPMIVFEDVNLDRVTSGALWGSLTACGQSCTSVERIYIQDSLFENFQTELLKKLNKLTQQDFGQMIDPRQISVIADHLEDALQKGAKLLSGHNWDRKSAQIPPLVLTHTTKDMKVRVEESFGPFVVLIPFQTESEAIAHANNSEYGLSASVWSNDLKRAERVALKIRTGNVSINNVMLTEGNPHLPFGGIQKSGFGRFKGSFGFEAFSNIKSLLIDKNSSKLEVNWFPYTKTKYTLFSNFMQCLFAKSFFKRILFVVWGLRLDTYKPKQN